LPDLRGSFRKISPVARIPEWPRTGEQGGQDNINDSTTLNLRGLGLMRPSPGSTAIGSDRV